MGDVVQFTVQPKSLNKSYKRHNFTVTYVPSTKKWSYDVELVQTTHLMGTADTQMKAVRAAEKQIDQVLKIQGRDTG